NLACPPCCVTDLLADGADVCPKMLGQIHKLLVGNHCRDFSSRCTNSWSEMPIASQIWRISKMSRRRSPDSYLLTNDCGCPNFSARSLWRSPAPSRICRRTSCSFSCSGVNRLFFIKKIGTLLTLYPNIGYKTGRGDCRLLY